MNSDCTGFISIEGSLTNDGAITNYCDIEITGTLNNNASLFSDGVASLLNSGTLNNSGVIYYPGLGGFTNEADGEINNESVFISFEYFTNKGTLYNNWPAFLYNAGSMLNSDGRIENSGTITNTSLMTNTGTIDNSGLVINTSQNGRIDNGGTITNTGTLDNNDTFNNLAPGLLHNQGTINNNAPSGILNNAGIITTICGAVYNGNPPTGNPIMNAYCIFLAGVYG